ncbi:biotin transporter BioY [Candidatus Babeliales bacterium]|nr:biotin transporter BioY [Candidatus Babeliales bacterium]
MDKKITHKILLKFEKSKIFKFIFYISLSWLYAICSQIIIPLPFNSIPISLQPLPLFLLSLTIGWPAVYAYFLTIFQTALGAPFFSGFQGGTIKLLGPTGGYIFGFAFAMIFLASIKKYKNDSFVFIFLKLLASNIIIYSFGIIQLSYFVPKEKLYLLGLTPFIFGDLIKAFIVCSVILRYNLKK